MEQRHTWVFTDIETAGLNRFQHPIIEIGAIAVEAGTWKELATFEFRIQFDVRKADPKALGVSKYSPSLWKRTALPPRVVAPKFSVFLRRYATVQCISRMGKPFSVAQLAGHNAEAFDGPFLHTWYRRRKKFFPASRRVLCTKQMAMWFFELNQGLTPPENYKLGTLCRYFDLTEPDHTALNDIRATVELARTISKLSLQGVSDIAA